MTDSYTSDGITVGGGDWVWEWEWTCFVPTRVGEEGGEWGRMCQYEGGEVIAMPGVGDGIFVGGGGGREFEVGKPLYFDVQVRVREREGGEVVTEGRWQEVFSVIEREDSELTIEENQWMCDDGAVGYSVFFLLFLLWLSTISPTFLDFHLF